jgi:S1-C subfamily serine protease
MPTAVRSLSILSKDFPDAPLAETMLGSGVILDAALGLVVTANHVVHDAETVAVAPKIIAWMPGW